MLYLLIDGIRYLSFRFIGATNVFSYFVMIAISLSTRHYIPALDAAVERNQTIQWIVVRFACNFLYINRYFKKHV